MATLKALVGSATVNDATVINLMRWRICIVHLGIFFAR